MTRERNEGKTRLRTPEGFGEYSVFLTSVEYTSEPTIGQTGTFCAELVRDSQSECSFTRARTYEEQHASGEFARFHKFDNHPASLKAPW